MKSNPTTTTPKVSLSARAIVRNIPVSTKQSVEISNMLRYKSTASAKKMLEQVVAGQRAVPFKRSIMDLGHKPGMGPGSYPQKAVREFLTLLHSVEANAQFKSMDVTNLKIIKLIANKAAIPRTGGRYRVARKRTHVEIEVREQKKMVSPKKQPDSKNQQKEVKETRKAGAKKVEEAVAVPEEKGMSPAAPVSTPSSTPSSTQSSVSTMPMGEPQP